MCASCHQQMDPLGFAMEHFDAIGRWRDTDAGVPINALIQWDGQDIENSKQFREALLGHGNEFLRTVTEKLISYSLGRGVHYYDAATIRQLVRDLEQNNNRWSSLIAGIVRSQPFQMRKSSTEG